MKEPRRNPAVWQFSLSFALLGIGAVIRILSSTVLRSRIIIEYGVRALGTVKAAGNCLIIIGLVLLLAAILPRLLLFMSTKQAKKRVAARQQQRSRELDNYAEDSTNPELTRKMLQQFQAQTPDYYTLMYKCLRQMDTVDTLQARQDLLIKMNGATYLKDTVAALDDVERRICKKLRSILNLCIAAVSPADLDMPKVERIFDDNKKMLDAAQELLKASTDWINQYDDAGVSDLGEIEKWIAVIRETLKED